MSTVSGVSCNSFRQRYTSKLPVEPAYRRCILQISKILVKRPSRRRSVSEPRPDTLLDRAVWTFCQQLQLNRYTAADIASLPTDVCQQVLDQLIRSNKLDLEALKLFCGQAIWSLSVTDYPIAVTDSWIKALDAAHLKRVHLSNTEKASTQQLSVLIRNAFEQGSRIICCAGY